MSDMSKADTPFDQRRFSEIVRRSERGFQSPLESCPRKMSAALSIVGAQKFSAHAVVNTRESLRITASAAVCKTIRTFTDLHVTRYFPDLDR
jgi:hypothetical protein